MSPCRSFRRGAYYKASTGFTRFIDPNNVTGAGSVLADHTFRLNPPKWGHLPWNCRGQATPTGLTGSSTNLSGGAALLADMEGARTQIERSGTSRDESGHERDRE